MAATSPVQLDLNAPLKVARWRVIGNPIMAIPHFIVLYVMNAINGILAIVSFFTILFTGNIPEGIFNFRAAVMRYQWRVMSFALYLREPYPAFDFTSSAADTGNDPASFSIAVPASLSRGLIFIKWLLAIPQFIVLFVYAIGLYIVMIIAFFAVLFTGSWPEGLRKYVVGFMRFSMRVTAYVYLMTDAYPPFGLS